MLRFSSIEEDIIISLLQLDLTHLGTMFVLDRDHDGQISLDDLMKFATFCASKGKDCQPHEFQLQVFFHCCLMARFEVSPHSPP